jgi:hypothetical protein
MSVIGPCERSHDDIKVLGACNEMVQSAQHMLLHKNCHMMCLVVERGTWMGDECKGRTRGVKMCGRCMGGHTRCVVMCSGFKGVCIPM